MRLFLVSVILLLGSASPLLAVGESTHRGAARQQAGTDCVQISDSFLERNTSTRQILLSVSRTIRLQPHESGFVAGSCGGNSVFLAGAELFARIDSPPPVTSHRIASTTRCSLTSSGVVPLEGVVTHGATIEFSLTFTLRATRSCSAGGTHGLFLRVRHETTPARPARAGR
jgi:hypothetical protein